MWMAGPDDESSLSDVHACLLVCTLRCVRWGAKVYRAKSHEHCQRREADSSNLMYRAMDGDGPC